MKKILKQKTLLFITTSLMLFTVCITLSEAAYTPGFEWNLVADFDYPANGISVSSDTEGNAVWEYFGNTRIHDTSGTPWAARTPQNDSLLPNVITGTGLSGYTNSGLETPSVQYRLYKNESPGGAVMIDGRDQRVIGFRWVSPVSGTVDITATFGNAIHPVSGSSTKYGYAIDIYDANSGVLTRNIATALVGHYETATVSISSLNVKVGDMVCASFAGTSPTWVWPPTPYPVDFGELSTDMTITLSGPKTCQEVWQQGYGIEFDLNKDCRVDLGDIAVFVENWLSCNAPEDSRCGPTW